MSDSETAVKLSVRTPQGGFLGGTVDIEFKHRTLSERLVLRNVNASGEIPISGLQRAPQGGYQITVSPTDVFNPESQFFNVPASGFVAITVVIKPRGTPEPNQNGTIILKVLDEQGQFLKGKVTVSAKHQTLNDHFELKNMDASKEITITGLRRTPNGNYQVTVTPTDAFSPQSKLVTVPADGSARVDFQFKTPVSEPTPKGSVDGEFVDGCHIDLPKNDVIEAIEFERFFRLNLRFGELHDSPLPDPASPDANPETNIRLLPLAIFLPFRQEWKLRGYSRGRLVNSFTLGPEEEQTIDIFKWDRITRSMESSTSFESDETTESSSTRRDTNDIARDITRQTGFELSTQGKVGFQVGVVNADLSAGANARSGVNEAEKSTRTAILDATSRSTGHVRTSRTLKVVEGREFGQETRITRRLRNVNKCHTLTIPFFEILANYTVSTSVRRDAVRLVVLVDSANLIALTGFDRKTIRVHEAPLRLALLDSSLVDGFAAARFLDARDRACAVLCEGCSCVSIEGQTAGDDWNNLAAAADALGVVVNTLRVIVSGIELAFKLSVPLLGLLAPLPPPTQQELVSNVKRYLFFKSLATYAPHLLIHLAALGVGGGVATVTVTQVEAIAQLLAGIPQDALPKLVHDPEISKAVGFDAYGLLVLAGNDPIFAAPAALTAFWSRVSGPYDDGQLPAAITVFRAAYEKWKKFMLAQIEKDEKATALQKIEKEERELRILEAYPLRETADARERLDALLAHLNDLRNFAHYRFAVWNERSGATDTTLITLALAGLIDPTPVGIVGDQLAVPVRMTPGSKMEKFFTDSITDLVNHTVRNDDEHILPTPALYAEAIVGACCSCEDAIERATELDLDRMELNNKILDLETQRLRARLDIKPAQLDRELAAPAIRVEVDKSNVPV